SSSILVSIFFLFFFMILFPLTSTLFPYTTLFRSHYLRETGAKIGSTFDHFSNAAQRLGVYTSHDYIQILSGLIKDWNIENISGLDRKSTRLNSSHVKISYAVFCLKKKI